MKKILITQAIHFDKKRNTYYDYVDIRLIKTFYRLGFKPITISNFFNEPEKYLKDLKVEGIILSGGSDTGKFPLRDRNEIKLISFAIKKKIPLIGICRGMQIVNKYFKGKLVKIDGHVKKKHLIENLVFKNKAVVNSYHNYAIDKKKLNRDLKPIFMCKKDRSIEAFIHIQESILGIMWHPEREKKLKNFDKQIIQQFILKTKKFRKKLFFKDKNEKI